MSKNSKKYGKLYYEFSPSIKQIISDYVRDKTTPIPKSYGIPRTVVPIPPDGLEFFHFALVVDGEVKEVLKVNREIANLFNQEFSLVEYSPSMTEVKRGNKFEDGKFVE